SSTMIVSRTSIEVSLERASFAALGVAVDVLRGVAEIPLDLDGEAHALQIEIGGAAAPLATIETVRLIEEAEGALEDARS
ncbi:hypothetical protein, partial [Staphylococcus aureus]